MCGYGLRQLDVLCNEGTRGLTNNGYLSQVGKGQLEDLRNSQHETLVCENYYKLRSSDPLELTGLR